VTIPLELDVADVVRQVMTVVDDAVVLKLSRERLAS
jgi:hypothetical protein